METNHQVGQTYVEQEPEHLGKGSFCSIHTQRK